MAYYKTPADMYEKRAENSKRMGDRHWAMAKNGEGDYHYGKAREYYRGAKENAKRAEQARQGKNKW